MFAYLRRLGEFFSDYIGYEDDEIHDHPGHLCGIDCDRDNADGIFKTTRHRAFAYSVVLYFSLGELTNWVIDWVKPPFDITDDSRNAICEVALIIIWLAMARLSRWVADSSHRVANHLVWMSKATKWTAWIAPALQVLITLLVGLLAALHI